MKKLVIVDAEDREAPFASALAVRFYEPERIEPSNVELRLARAVSLPDEVEALQPFSRQYESILFIGAFFPGVNGKAQFSEEMKNLFVKWHSEVAITCFDKTNNALRIYTEGKVEKTFSEHKRERRVFRNRRFGNLARELIVFFQQEFDSSFDPGYLINIQRDSYLQYRLETILGEFTNSENHDSGPYNEFIWQIAYSSPDQQDALQLDYHSMSGDELTKLLLSHKELSVNLKQDDWKKLTGNNWQELLCRELEFEDECSDVDGWQKLTGDNWFSLLYRQFTCFESYCNWSKLNETAPQNIVRLFAKHPEAIEKSKYEWSRLDADSWGYLLARQPQFSEHCKKWKEFSGDNWTSLLVEQPQFSKYCKRWNDFSGDNWQTLLCRRPEDYVKRCSDFKGWKKLTPTNWSELLGVQPAFKDRCGETSWQEMKAEDWYELLYAQPRFADECVRYDGFSSLNRDNLGEDFTTKWGNLLQKDKTFERFCQEEAWQAFSGKDWSGILQCQPYFKEKCTQYNGWDRLSDEDWTDLLARQPFLELYKKTPLSEKLTPDGWVRLLWRNPEKASQCKDWDIFTPQHWNELIERRPELVERCKKENKLKCLGPKAWSMVLLEDPAYISQCPCLKDFKSEDWLDLLRENPQMARLLDQFGGWERFDADEWVVLLGAQPQFASHKCTKIIWEKFSPDNWTMLITVQPQFARFMPEETKEKLFTENWVKIIAEQPQFFKSEAFITQIDELRGCDWCSILWSQPDITDAEIIPWNLFSADDWEKLLREQPRFSRFFFNDNIIEKFSETDRLQIQLSLFHHFSRYDVETNNLMHLIDFSPSQLRQLKSTDIVEYLAKSERPELAGLDFSSLDGYDWCNLLIDKPQYAELCSQNNGWEQFDGWHWCRLLQDHPDFACYCDKCKGWKSFDGGDWSSLLQKQPDFKSRCDEHEGWITLDGGNWVFLLTSHPNFEDYCNTHHGWKLLDGSDWVYLLQRHPDFENACDKHHGWKCLDGSDWVSLLDTQPGIAEKCEWKKLNSVNWLQLLRDNPDFLNECKWESLKPAHQILLWNQDIDFFPKLSFLKKIPWNELEGNELTILLSRYSDLDEQYNLEKQYYEKGIFQYFTGAEWFTLLKKQPLFVKYCPLESLNPKMRLAILSLPGIATKFKDKKNVWPDGEELDITFKISKNDLRHTGRWYRRKSSRWRHNMFINIDWRSLTSVKPEYATACPKEQLNELTIQGWYELIRHCTQMEKETTDTSSGKQTFIHHKELMDEQREELLWEYYSVFLRLPQSQIDEYKQEDAAKDKTTCKAILDDAIATYHKMLVGKGLKPLRAEIRQAARNRFPVLIIGQSGTGKENTARMIHEWSGRTGSFEAFNGASSTDNLIEDELFGHVKGAFTGGYTDKKGLFKIADNGTLFFDEIAEFPMETQAKLLRAMQWKHPSKKDKNGILLKEQGQLVYSYRPVGGTEPEEVDVRIVAATNRKLEQMIGGDDPTGQHFREDLYYRFNSIVLRTLPLNEHKDDIDEIANLFWRIELNQPECLDVKEIAYLKSLDYHANVRELQQLLTQYSIYRGSKTLEKLKEELERIRTYLGKPQTSVPSPAEAGTLSEPSPESSATNPPVMKTLTENSPDNSATAPVDMDDYICILDETTQSFKKADEIAAEYAQKIRNKHRTNEETAHVLGISINTLKKRLYVRYKPSL